MPTMLDTLLYWGTKLYPVA